MSNAIHRLKGGPWRPRTAFRSSPRASEAPTINFSSAATDGADVLLANVAPRVAHSSATTDGADVLLGNVSSIVGISSATTDGADILLGNLSIRVAASSATTDGADVLLANIAPRVALSSSTTEGADLLAAVVVPLSPPPAITPAAGGRPLRRGVVVERGQVQPPVPRETIIRWQAETSIARQQLPALDEERQRATQRALELAAFHATNEDSSSRLLAQLENRERYFAAYLEVSALQRQNDADEWALRERIDALWQRELQLRIWYRNAALLLLLN